MLKKKTDCLFRKQAAKDSFTLTFFLNLQLPVTIIQPPVWNLEHKDVTR